MPLTPEQHDKMIKEANRKYWADGMAWLDRQLEKINGEKG
jgi:hypothetical protein